MTTIHAPNHASAASGIADPSAIYAPQALARVAGPIASAAAFSQHNPPCGQGRHASAPHWAAAGHGWAAELALAYVRRGDRTVLVHPRHRGPLRVQKPLYPEGETVCHTIVLHPPAGIVGGDSLAIRIDLGAQTHVLLTTPGAGKWYRSDGRVASGSQRIGVARGAVCEWLPQETIVFDGAIGSVDSHFSLASGSALIAADMLCLGRTGCGESFSHGRFALRTSVSVDGRPIWLERGCLDGGGALLGSPVGLNGQPVSATMLASGPGVDEGLRDACREIVCQVGQSGVTLLPEGLLVARWLGPATEPGRAWMKRVWACVRPAVAGRQGAEPRIWCT